MTNETLESMVRAFEDDAIREIAKRGGEVSILHSPCQGAALKRCEDREVKIVSWGTSEGAPVALLKAEGWRYYSRRFGSRPARLAYLAGVDDSGTWATRVPGTVASADEAVKWLVPAAVHKARAMGRRVLRQGDVYAIETTRHHDGGGLERQWPVGIPAIGNHVWHHRSRLLLHPEHHPMLIHFPCRFMAQTAYQMGRTGRQGMAD